jgi:D-alanyl-D-alanine carboxypeptidase
LPGPLYFHHRGIAQRRSREAHSNTAQRKRRLFERCNMLNDYERRLDDSSFAISAPPAFTPHGLEAITAMFGDIYEYIRKDRSLDPRWQADALVRIELPFPLTLSWDHAKSVTQMTCHKKLGEVFKNVFATIAAQGLQTGLRTFGGCFAFRQQRTGRKLSAHAWGIAVDLNPETNVQGSPGDMALGTITVFRDAGFEWGGDWSGKTRDPMHFQFCTGY